MKNGCLTVENIVWEDDRKNIPEENGQIVPNHKTDTVVYFSDNILSLTDEAKAMTVLRQFSTDNVPSKYAELTEDFIDYITGEDTPNYDIKYLLPNIVQMDFEEAECTNLSQNNGSAQIGFVVPVTFNFAEMEVYVEKNHPDYKELHLPSKVVLEWEDVVSVLEHGIDYQEKGFASIGEYLASEGISEDTSANDLYKFFDKVVNDGCYEKIADLLSDKYGFLNESFDVKPEYHTVDKEFKYVFQLSKKVTFEVDYYTLGSNQNPYFSTSANEFNQPKTDYSRGGQAQEELCTGLAKKFYEKWDKHHLKELDEPTYKELLSDIEQLKDRYNYIEKHGEEARYNHSFYAVKELSKLEPKQAQMQTFSKSDVDVNKKVQNKNVTKE